jgi:hypothetical protein
MTTLAPVIIAIRMVGFIVAFSAVERRLDAEFVPVFVDECFSNCVGK